MREEEKEQLFNEIIENLHKATLAIPILDGYELIRENTGAIFAAKSKDHSVEQYLEDGHLFEEETFEGRINKVIEETNEAITNLGFRNNELLFLEDYNTDLLNFKLYLQDNVVGNTVIRQINAYFIEPESRYFYEITLSAPPILKIDINDNVTNNIKERLLFILNNIRYNDENPIQ